MNTSLKEYLADTYLDWLNNYLTVGRFAEVHGMEVEDAFVLIRLGRRMQEERATGEFPEAPQHTKPAEQRSDGMPNSGNEHHLRRLLAARVGMPNTYYDDGEAQGYELGIAIDFMREPVADIDAKLRALNVARAALAEQPTEPVYLEVSCPAHPKWLRVNAQQFEDYKAHGWNCRKLYTAPQPAKREPHTKPRTVSPRSNTT